MTMKKQWESSNIWSRVRDDRDVDDLIFGSETRAEYEAVQTCSDR